ncbi:MAG: cation diffusion facilitator family transporter [candidate division Zixibacteria bacterium]|nr:cation diffusion facilitator family transporter [candidate division Zixibacteria bacterium]
MKNERKARAAALSVASNTTLVVMKLLAGIFSGSVSILSEAIHSANDLLAAVIAFFSVRIADQPPDKEHPFGHGKAESISGAIEAGLIIFAAVWIAVEAVRKIVSGGEIEHVGFGSLIMGFSVVVNFFVSRYLFKVAKAEDSIALEADAHHLSTDVFTSLGVTIGLILVWITGWHIIDPIVALGVAVLIGKIGWRLTRDASRHLMDHQLPEAEVKQITQILDTESRIQSWHDLRTRKSGSYRHVDLHIVLRSDSSLMEAHEIADDLERRISGSLRAAHVVIHTDPYDDSTVQPGV